MPAIQWTNLPPALRDHLFDRPALDPRSRDNRTERKQIRLDLLPRPAADAVEISRRSRFGRMKKVMAEFVEENRELFRLGKFAVNGDIIPPLQTKIKPANRQRHFLHTDL